LIVGDFSFYKPFNQKAKLVTGQSAAIAFFRYEFDGIQRRKWGKGVRIEMLDFRIMNTNIRDQRSEIRSQTKPDT